MYEPREQTVQTESEGYPGMEDLSQTASHPPPLAPRALPPVKGGVLGAARPQRRAGVEGREGAQVTQGHCSALNALGGPRRLAAGLGEPYRVPEVWMRVPRVPRASRVRAVGGLAPGLAILDRGEL